MAAILWEAMRLRIKGIIPHFPENRLSDGT